MDSVTERDFIRETLELHSSRCDRGPRICADCQLHADVHAQTALAIARTEKAQISDWIKSHRDTCVYCGDDSTSRDHLVPQPWTGNATRKLVPTVPACQDCNSRIQAAPVFTIAGRAEVAAASLREAHSKTLHIADRTQDELDEFEGRTRVNLIAAQYRRQIVRRRLAVLDQGGAPFVPDALLIAKELAA